MPTTTRRRVLGLLAIASLAWTAPPAAAQTSQGKLHTLGKPSGLVHLFAVASPGQTKAFDTFRADGTNGGPFTLAPGTVLVVTDVRVARTAIEGLHEGRIVNPGMGERLRFHYDSTKHPSHHLGLASGAVFSTPPEVRLFANSVGAAEVHLHGYLAKDK